MQKILQGQFKIEVIVLNVGVRKSGRETKINVLQKITQNFRNF